MPPIFPANRRWRWVYSRRSHRSTALDGALLVREPTGRSLSRFAVAALISEPQSRAGCPRCRFFSVMSRRVFGQGRHGPRGGYGDGFSFGFATSARYFYREALAIPAAHEVITTSVSQMRRLRSRRPVFPRDWFANPVVLTSPLRFPGLQDLGEFGVGELRFLFGSVSGLHCRARPEFDREPMGR